MVIHDHLCDAVGKGNTALILEKLNIFFVVFEIICTFAANSINITYAVSHFLALPRMSPGRPC